MNGDRLNPQSMRELRHLFALHGGERLRWAIEELEKQDHALFVESMRHERISGERGREGKR